MTASTNDVSCNTGPVINEKLPSEILLQIFRDVRPSDSDYMAPIRLTHVCRAWRTLIHSTPLFWINILNPREKKVFTDRPSKFPIVLTAFEKSQPVSPLSFSSHCAFLPVLCTLQGHVSRISTLWLDCSDDRDHDIRPFLDLRMPELEKLTLWRGSCSFNRAPEIALDTSTVQFPRLSYLRTNCMRVGPRWVAPTIHTLIFSSRASPRLGEYSDLYKRKQCCRFRTLSKVFEALARCPDLEELDIDGCLPEPIGRIATADYIRLAPLRMHRLKVVHLDAWAAEAVRAVLEMIDVPDMANITLRSRNHALSDLLPRRNPLTIIPQIVSVTISTEHPQRGSLDGSIKCGDRRLSLHSDDIFPHADADDYSLLPFFEGATSCFLPSHITRLKVVCYTLAYGDSAGWLWLYEHHPRVTDLYLEVFDPRDVLASLPPANTLQHLEHLTLIMSAPRDSDDVGLEVIVSTLEERHRASGGTRLRSLSFTLRVDSEEVEDRLTDDQIARLRATVEELSIETVDFD
ncbi:hypothetical protein OH76DRAFT_1201051 [Lentinus brumalis]|uniref:F-box domain-containing protein n=1 Tax=Lentinus brumalis TaxID=2498619 RepID=A0A371CT95_9APHY|nr:hypothetical protein OH76DRAFT_1201051 [Polyporus brumalis]